MMAAKIEEEPVSFEGLNDELQTIFSEMSKSRSDLSACIDELQNSVSEMLDLTANAQQWEKDMKDLEDSEKKLIEEFNKVMSNLYLLPTYVLAASSGVSGLLSGHPRVCWLLGTITVVIIVLLAAMGLAISFVHRQLTDFKAKRKELVDERVKLHQRFLQRHVSSFSFVLQNSNPTLTKVENYEPKNPELDFLVQHYGKFLLLIITGGLLFAFMLLVAAYHELCGSKSVPCTPCTLHTPHLHSTLPLEPVPDHVPFSACVPCLRPYQDM